MNKFFNTPNQSSKRLHDVINNLEKILNSENKDESPKIIIKESKKEFFNQKKNDLKEIENNINSLNMLI